MPVFEIEIEIFAIRTRLMKGVKVETKASAGGSFVVIGAPTEAKAKTEALKVADDFGDMIRAKYPIAEDTRLVPLIKTIKEVQS